MKDREASWQFRRYKRQKKTTNLEKKGEIEIYLKNCKSKEREECKVSLTGYVRYKMYVVIFEYNVPTHIDFLS